MDYAAENVSSLNEAIFREIGAPCTEQILVISGGEVLDSSKKVMTGTMEGTDPTGALSKMKEITEWKDADNRIFTLYMPLPDGKEIPVMKITYKRRK